MKHVKSCLVRLATGIRKKVSELVMECPIELNGLLTKVTLNFLPLGYYDTLIGMDWLEKHKVKVGFYEESHECIDEEGRPRLIREIPIQVSVRKISTLELSKFDKKGCQLYASCKSDSLEDKGPNIEYFLWFQEFKYLFPNEVSRLPPKRDIDFTIDRIPRVV